MQSPRRGHYEIAADLWFLSGGWAIRRGKRRISAVRVIRCASSGVLCVLGEAEEGTIMRALLMTRLTPVVPVLWP